MQKIVIILSLVILSSGCSVFRKGNNENYNTSFGKGTDEYIKNVVNQNVTNEGFFIQKADLRISSEDGTMRGIGSIKFVKPDKFLVIIRSTTGLEAVRIFISRDTILINSRMNRKFYYGSTSYLMDKYGVTADILPLLFGDCLIKDFKEKRGLECIDNKLIVKSDINNINVDYTIDCSFFKCIKAIPYRNSAFNSLEISYTDFIDNNGLNIPGRITIKDNQRHEEIEIKIRNIEAPWKGIIDFIPGSKYELIELL